MKSFSSSLSKAGSAITEGADTGNGVSDALLNAFYSTSKTNTLYTGVDELDFESKLDSTKAVELIAQSDYTNSSDNAIQYPDVILDNLDEFSEGFEDSFKFPTVAIHSMNNYKFVFDNSIQSVGGTYQTKKDKKKAKISMNSLPGVPALFNPLFSVNAHGFMKALPLIYRSNSYKGVINDKMGHKTNKIKVDKYDFRGFDLSDCSIHRLVGLSEEIVKSADPNKSSNPLHQIMGLSIYKYSDFMYCKDLGKVSNNHLITLRKFSTPIGDNIFIGAIVKRAHKDADKSEDMSGDVGRLVTWFGTADNKLEDIMQYEMKASWKDLNAKIEQQDSQEENSEKPLNSIINSLSPQYNAFQAGGFSKGANIWSMLGSHAGGWTGKLLGSQGPYDNTTLRNYDENKVYTPKNTIQDTVLYEGKLTFNQEFTLNFCYKLRAYDNINPKSAFLDLLGNILEVTYRRGKFWGGARKLAGAPRNASGWKTANAFINNAWDKLGGFLEALFRGNIDFGSLLASASELVSKAGEQAKKIVDTAQSGGISALSNKAVDAFKSFNAKTGLTNGLKGQLMNSLGRPALYAWQSLLSGNNVGLWHITIGNPLNPIAAFGNMIITSAKVQHSGPLGIDDFPTDIRVSVTLKHARSRDVTEIGKMYTRGVGTLYNPLAQNVISRYLRTNATGIEALAKDNQEKIEAAKKAKKEQEEQLKQIKKEQAEAKAKEDAKKQEQKTDTDSGKNLSASDSDTQDKKTGDNKKDKKTGDNKKDKKTGDKKTQNQKDTQTSDKKQDDSNKTKDTPQTPEQKQYQDMVLYADATAEGEAEYKEMVEHQNALSNTDEVDEIAKITENSIADLLKSKHSSDSLWVYNELSIGSVDAVVIQHISDESA